MMNLATQFTDYSLDKLPDGFKVLPRAVVTTFPAGHICCPIGIWIGCNKLFSLRRRIILRCRCRRSCCCCCCGHNTCLLCHSAVRCANLFMWLWVSLCCLINLWVTIAPWYIFSLSLLLSFPQTLTCYVNICFCFVACPLTHSRAFHLFTTRLGVCLIKCSDLHNLYVLVQFVLLISSLKFSKCKWNNIMMTWSSIVKRLKCTLAVNDKMNVSHASCTRRLHD